MRKELSKTDAHPDSNRYQRMLGRKHYELTNHLGNVLSTVTDRKLAIEGTGGLVEHWMPETVSFTDYYPFGMQMDGRTGFMEGYRWGFQGQEKDDEVKGEGNSINYRYRMHDTRVGRFFAVDPLASKYPYYSPYAFSGNRILDAIELEGLEPEIISENGDQINLKEGNKSFSIGGEGLGLSIDDKGRVYSISTPDGKMFNWDDDLKEYMNQEVTENLNKYGSSSPDYNLYIDSWSDVDVSDSKFWKKLAKTSDAWVNGEGPFSTPESFTGEEFGRSVVNNLIPGVSTVISIMNIYSKEFNGTDIYGDKADLEMVDIMFPTVDAALNGLKGPVGTLAKNTLSVIGFYLDYRKYTRPAKE